MHMNTNTDINEAKKSFFIVLLQKKWGPKQSETDCKAPGQHKNLYEMKDNDNIAVLVSPQHLHRVGATEI